MNTLPFAMSRCNCCCKHTPLSAGLHDTKYCCCTACTLKPHYCCQSCLTDRATRCRQQRHKMCAVDTGAEAPSEPQVMNPPMIHALAVPPTSDSPAAQLVAAACGDGTVSVWDLDKVRCFNMTVSCCCGCIAHQTCHWADRA